MSEKIKILGIKREKGFLYFIDKEGDVSCVRMGKKRRKKEEIPLLPETKEDELEEKKRLELEKDVWEETLSPKEKSEELQMIRVPDDIIETKEGGDVAELREKFGNLVENKFVWLLVGIGIGSLVTYFITRSYYGKKIEEYVAIIEKQQVQINQLLSLQTTGLSSETSEQYILRKYRESPISV